MKGIVIKSTGLWCTVRTDEGDSVECRMRGSFRMKDIKSTNPIAVGDRVVVELEANEEKGVITIIEERKNYIVRKSINLSKQFHIIAANIDQAFLMATLINPRTSLGFMDRFLITAESFRIPVIIVFNKIDIYSEEEKKELMVLMKIYSAIGYTCYGISTFDSTDVAFLKTLMKDKTNLLSGHSGVGKSTFTNALEPGLNLKISEISKAHNKGMHTTTFAEMFELSTGGFIIDTPGIKELGITKMTKEELSHFFPEMRALLNKCRFNNCLHINEPSCAVINAVEKGDIAESRYRSYLSIMQSEELKTEFEK